MYYSPFILILIPRMAAGTGCRVKSLPCLQGRNFILQPQNLAEVTAHQIATRKYNLSLRVCLNTHRGLYKVSKYESVFYFFL